MFSFLEWLSRNRKPVGYTVGSLNLLACINYLASGKYDLAAIWFVIGMVLIFDTYDYKN